MTLRRYPEGHPERKSDRPPSALPEITIAGHLRSGNTAGVQICTYLRYQKYQ